MEARIGLRLEREESALHLANGRIAASTGSAEDADAMISGEPPVLAAMYGGQLLEALVASSALRIEGDRGPVRRFVTLFLLPPKASP